MFRCKDGTTGRCMENLEDFYVVLHCERFHRDKTGPWSMLSDAMYSASKCGEQIVNLQIKKFLLIKLSFRTSNMND